MHGSGGRRRPSAEFVGHILRREGWGCPREGLGGGGGGGEVGSLRLEGLGSDVDGRLVRAMGGGAGPERGGSGRTLLRK